MSVERIRVVLKLDPVERVATRESRQQITPDMKFTCDGIITKWIIGADWTMQGHDILYPELQLWREIGNDIYQKINGTLITIETERDDRVYEYDNFTSIPFQAGDIFGVFVPRDGDSKLRLRHEHKSGPTNYYLTGDYAMSLIDLKQTPTVPSATYHPLVTVEISECTKNLFYYTIFLVPTHYQVLRVHQLLTQLTW